MIGIYSTDEFLQARIKNVCEEQNLTPLFFESVTDAHGIHFYIVDVGHAPEDFETLIPGIQERDEATIIAIAPADQHEHLRDLGAGLCFTREDFIENLPKILKGEW